MLHNEKVEAVLPVRQNECRELWRKEVKWQHTLFLSYEFFSKIYIFPQYFYYKFVLSVEYDEVLSVSDIQLEFSDTSTT